ncbi:MAG: TetR/AcrR family transcriptional regulator [Anaerofustis sp.]
MKEKNKDTDMTKIRELNAAMRQKRANLLNAARYLFIEKGFHNTSIDAIVNSAQVAKGTFYLYFKDKEDILNEIVYEINRTILLKAYNAARELHTKDKLERFIFMIDSIIDHFIKNPDELVLVHRNFSWPLIKERIFATQEDADLSEALNWLVENYRVRKTEEDEIANIIYAIVEMCGSLCYSCIIKQQPTDIFTMKPTLYKMIRRILS